VATELTVKRETSFLMELRRGTFDVVLDGVVVGSIDRQGTFETPIEAGHHQLQVRTGRYSSRPRSFDVADGDAVRFRCNGARIWPVYLASIVAPSLALTLNRE
jgi:hypothetical protein